MSGTERTSRDALLSLLRDPARLAAPILESPRWQDARFPGRGKAYPGERLKL